MSVTSKLFRFITTIAIVVIFSSCSKRNLGNFIFYQGNRAIKIENYDIYVNNLDNVYLIIKDYNIRNYIINNKLDSMNYVVGHKIYKADLNKISGNFSKFHLITQNDGKRLFINGFNEYNQEKLYLGTKADLKFIIDNSEIILEKDDK